MNIKEVINSGKVDFTGIEQSYFLLGLLSAFDNRFLKFAVNSLTKSLSMESAKDHIHINAVAPGITKTDMRRNRATGPKILTA